MDSFDFDISNALVAFAEEKLILRAESSEAEIIKSALDELISGLKHVWGEAIEDIIVHGSYSRGTILPRKYDPVSDVDILVVLSKRYRTEHSRQSPMFFRKMLLGFLQDLYPKRNIKEDFPSIRLELDFIIFDIVPAIFEIDASQRKTYLIPNHDLKWEKTSNDSTDLGSKSNFYVNLIRLCKHWNACSKYPVKSFYLERIILDFSFSNLESIFSSFITILDKISRSQQVLIFSQKDQQHWTMGRDFYDAFIDIYSVLGSEDELVIFVDLAKNLRDKTKLKIVRPTFNTDTIAVLELIGKFTGYEPDISNNLLGSHKYAILSQHLLLGLQDDWKGFPASSKYWKCRNEQLRDQMLQIQTRYNSQGQITNNLEI